MSSTTTKEPKTKKKVAKTVTPKTTSSHPPYRNMIIATLTKLALEKKPGTLKSISDHITNTYAAGNHSHLKQSLKRLVDSKELVKPKGIGLTGSFKLSKALQEASKKKKKPASKTAAKKPAAPKKAKPATASAKKPSPKKPSPKKSPAKTKPKPKPKPKDAKKPKKTTEAATKAAAKPAAKTKKPPAKKPKTPKKAAAKKK